jgi:hypothetical protein
MIDLLENGEFEKTGKESKRLIPGVIPAFAWRD